MEGEERRRGDGSWPEWIEPLRPDDLARRRLHEAVMERARPILAEYRPAAAWEVAAGWADVLVPVAAVASVLFTVLALQTGDGAVGPASGPLADERQGVRIEELLAEPTGTEPPALLTRRNRPDLDGVLEATLSHATER